MLIPGGCIKQVKTPELNLQVNNWDCVYLWILQNFKKGTFSAEHLLETTF